MKIKVCGMRDAENIRDVAQLGIDWMGFIFAKKSPRFVERVPARTGGEQDIRRVGVFVNASEDEICERVIGFGLDYIQLHGAESPDFCLRLRRRMEKEGKIVKLIKAINVRATSDILAYKDYEGLIDFLLFDTKTQLAGGSGKQFDWTILDAYHGDIPFLLSGGIGPEDADRIKDFHHPKCIGIDLNSRFETEPGLKDVEKLKAFIDAIK